MKPKLLCILHSSDTLHGASKVGEFIRNSSTIHTIFESHYIPIHSSDTISDIGKVNLKKFYFVAELFIKIAWALIVFRPDRIYFTASIRSVAFYRDLLLSTLWKAYTRFTSAEVYYHYHTKGVDDFVSTLPHNLRLTRWFLRDIKLILLSPMLESDFAQVQTYKKVLFLPNGVEDPITTSMFEPMIQKRFVNQSPINILFLSNMIKSKGYFEVLKLALINRNRNLHFHFAGAWQHANEKKEFFDFITIHQLQETVTFHGFVSGGQKYLLYEKMHLFIIPTRYPKEGFPLSILEAFSYGLPVIATDEASIPSILDDHSGIILDDLNDLPDALDGALKTLINPETSHYCRNRYLEHFTLERFEENFIRIIHD